MNTNTLAGAYATALTGAPKRTALTSAAGSSAQKPAELIIAPVAIPMQKREQPRVQPQMNDVLLLSVLQQSLTPADHIMARRTLLRPAPWEGAVE